mmetsp:Transcript_6883/g.31051  ORF Transcript_6883/g.31051 Transcript_6883/m.31051 type:complete len:203 (+) Transcript_6883:2699-3307(+)
MAEKSSSESSTAVSPSNSESLAKSSDSDSAYLTTLAAEARLGVFLDRGERGSIAAVFLGVALGDLTGVDLGLVLRKAAGEAADFLAGVATFLTGLAAAAAALAAWMCLKPSLPPAALVTLTSAAPLRRLGAMSTISSSSGRLPGPLRTCADAAAAPSPERVSIWFSSAPSVLRYESANWRPEVVDLQSGRRLHPANRARRSK